MRTVFGLVLAAAAVIHCSAAAELPGTSPPELASEVSDPREGSGADDQQVAHAAKLPNHPARPNEDFAAPVAEVTTTTHVTSTIVDPTSGATYAAGTFEDDIVVGGTLLKSKGDKDVFLLKVDARGVLEWVRAVGSAYAETKPRVTLDGAGVNVIGMTEGRMDCGLGPLGTWSSATFFVCVFGAADGASLSGGVFPTGAP
jgi:hypothetical protein